jgi:hypothetical protein
LKKSAKRSTASRPLEITVWVLTNGISAAIVAPITASVSHTRVRLPRGSETSAISTSSAPTVSTSSGSR